MTCIYLSKERYVAALHRLKKIVEDGIKLIFDDDTTPGDKSTTCTWGLCSDSKGAWPDPEDHLWPDQFTKHGRVAPKYLRQGHTCPIDSRTEKDAKKSGSGCFYTCRIFQAKGPRPSREKVIEWYDLRINQIKMKEANHGN